MDCSMEGEARSRFERDFDSIPGCDPGQKEAYVQGRLVKAGYADVINAHGDPGMYPTNGCKPDSLTHALGLAEDDDARYFAEQARGQ